MARVVLPPTPLASGLISTLLILTAARREWDIDIHRESGGAIAIDIDVDQNEIAQGIATVLRDKMLRPEKVSGSLPLIPGTGPGTDGRTISDILSEIGIPRLSLSARNRVEVYDNLVRFIERRIGELAQTISTLRISVNRGVLEIAWGGDQHSIPVIVKSETFYEIGRFGGISDRSRGRPDIGRVDYRASASLSSLLYALLLALQTGYEGGVTEAYMFTLLQLEPGKIANIQTKLINRIYTALLDETRLIGLKTWAQDYEGLRLASLLKLIDVYSELLNEFRVEPPINTIFNHIIIGATGRRFFPLTTVSISISELDTIFKTMKSFATELQIDIMRIAKLLRILIEASLRIMTRSTSSSVRELWYGIRMLTYSFIEGRRYELIDNAYRLLRLLSDERTGLRSELIRSTESTANDLGINLDLLLIEEDKNKVEALWKTMKKLINLVVA